MARKLLEHKIREAFKGPAVIWPDKMEWKVENKIPKFDYAALEEKVLADIIRITGLTAEQIEGNPEKASATYERLKQEARDKVSGTDWI